jgi:hypothetical protein
MGLFLCGVSTVSSINNILQNHQRKSHVSNDQCSCVQQTCAVLWKVSKRLEVRPLNFVKGNEKLFEMTKEIKTGFVCEYLRVSLVPCSSVTRCC